MYSICDLKAKQVSPGICTQKFSSLRDLRWGLLWLLLASFIPRQRYLNDLLQLSIAGNRMYEVSNEDSVLPGVFRKSQTSSSATKFGRPLRLSYLPSVWQRSTGNTATSKCRHNHPRSLRASGALMDTYPFWRETRVCVMVVVHIQSPWEKQADRSRSAKMKELPVYSRVHFRVTQYGGPYGQTCWRFKVQKLSATSIKHFSNSGWHNYF